MGEQDEWTWLDRWMNQTEAEFRAARQHVKARGYPQGWTEPRTPAIRDTTSLTCPASEANMHEIIIPMVPSKNLIGRTGWWRNAHNDRVVWRQRVRKALAGKDFSGEYIGHVECDWGARPMPASKDLGFGIIRETEEALAENGVVMRIAGVHLRQSGRGQGETRIVMDFSHG